VKKEENILILRAEQGSQILTEVLDANGMHYRDVKIYDILVDEAKRSEAHRKAVKLDFITFASGSGVRGFLEAGGSIPVGVKTVCIGEATAKMLKKHGYQEQIVAGKYNVNGLIDAILQEVEQNETL
jgi:uroporphyrinogen III methyltransferase/synthase